VSAVRERWFGLTVLTGLAVAALFALWLSPPDAQQGNVVRLLYLHVPTIWVAYLAFFVTGVASVLWLVPRTRRTEWDLLAGASAEVGVVFTGVTLVVGAIWGRPTWGTYWVWDARITSELVLLFLYFGFIALANAFEDPRRGDRAAALLAIIGVVNLPIIYFSVQWWNTLHQGSSVKLTGSSMHVAMLWGMLLMALSFWMYSIGAALTRVRAIILERERRTQWVRALAP